MLALSFSSQRCLWRRSLAAGLVERASTPRVSTFPARYHPRRQGPQELARMSYHLLKAACPRGVTPGTRIRLLCRHACGALECGSLLPLSHQPACCRPLLLSRLRDVNGRGGEIPRATSRQESGSKLPL
jgi:hypothetical protein